MESKSSATKLYLYLARRDKKGIKVLTTLIGLPKTARVDDVKMLGLDRENTEKISAKAHENRMLWELWVEPATSYIELQERLRKRGYQNLPISAAGDWTLSQGSKADTRHIGHKKIMTQRKLGS